MRISAFHYNLPINTTGIVGTISMNGYKIGIIYDLPLAILSTNPDQPRKVFSQGEINKLADSIKEKGLLQPILVKELEDGQIIIVSGERRFRAHKLLECETIPAWFTTGDAKELALVENLVREDLTAIETAEALKQLGDHLGDKPQTDLAKLIGKAESTVSEIMSLNKLPEDIRDIARGDKRFALRELKKIAAEKKPEKQKELFEKYQAKLEAASTEKQSNTRSKGADLHEKKIAAMQAYFSKMTEDGRLQELSSQLEQLVQLKDTIKKLINNIKLID
ncbi:MAG: ParB/RepB/Spo0J family partition protein [Verrucomicrobiae bacterium]|nr:ParB/RepB/Spo0J family partition protein [Verrucomicrobiae bacterium]